jgi:5'-3' exonuclease
MDKVLLIDGMNFIYRGNIKFGWGSDYSVEENKPSFVVVYNFFRNLRATIEEFDPNKVFFCSEGARNFRFDLFPDYKANRIIKRATYKEEIDDFSRQRNIIYELLPNLPIPIVRSERYECDDVVYTLADNMKDEEIIIVSNDSDFIQLLQKGYKNVRIYNYSKKAYITPPDYHYVSYKSLKGDKSDNIPSIVGPKTAEKLVSDIKKLAEFLDKSEENRANYALNKSLIELRVVSDDELQFVDYTTNFEYLKEQFINMNFKTIVEDKYWDRFCGTFKGLR